MEEKEKKRDELHTKIRELKDKRKKNIQNEQHRKIKMSKMSSKRGDPNIMDPRNIRTKFGEFDLTDTDSLIEKFMKEPDKIIEFINMTGIPKSMVADSITDVLKNKLFISDLNEDSIEFKNGHRILEILEDLHKTKKKL